VIPLSTEVKPQCAVERIGYSGIRPWLLDSFIVPLWEG